MILVIDNYDSFVMNLTRYIEQLGFQCCVKRHDEITVHEILYVMRPSHIILSPGPCTPNEAGICLELISAVQGTIPILGVCLGHQAIGQAMGGRVVKAIQPMHGKASVIHHDGQKLLSGLKNPLTVGRYHSLVIDKDTLPDCLQIHSITDEGDIMAVSHKAWPFFGVQFHPESILSECGYDLLSNFFKDIRH